MKNSLLVIATFLTGSVFAQDKKTGVPTGVKNAFSKDFPGVAKEKWEKEGSDYEVSFSQSGKQKSAVYSTDGNLKETEEVITISELPAGVVSYVTQHYR